MVYSSYYFLIQLFFSVFSSAGEKGVIKMQKYPI